MSLSPARPAALLDSRSPSDPTTLLLRRYTCGLTDVDCGNGYCCSVAHECVQQSGQTLCRLPNFSSADQTAEPASDAAGSAAATSSASQTVCLSSASSACVVLGADGTSSSSSSSSSGLSAGAIAGVVVGVVAALAAVIGAVVLFLCARRRRKRREAAAAGSSAAASGKEDGYGGYATQMPPSYQPVSGGDGLVDMYGGSNVGKAQGGVPGRAEVMGDISLPPVVQELPGSEPGRLVELDAGTEKKGAYQGIIVVPSFGYVGQREGSNGTNV